MLIFESTHFQFGWKTDSCYSYFLSPFTTKVSPTIECVEWGRKGSYSSKRQSCVNAKSHWLSATAGKPGTVGKYELERRGKKFTDYELGTSNLYHSFWIKNTVLEINKDKDGIGNSSVQLSSGNQVASYSVHTVTLTTGGNVLYAWSWPLHTTQRRGSECLLVGGLIKHKNDLNFPVRRKRNP